ncbi:MAG: AAA family ATPase [Lactobacillus crispatus]|jgi:wobble nucleotide-excising tRNase|nr:AAA family ATPase [Lactobacillus crispatus]
MEKLRSEITSVAISDATFKKNSPTIHPTFINYFFGNNGTGKSTIAKTIKSGNGVTFKYSNNQNDYEILLYDQNYIDENIKEYNGLPGVFTVNKKNADIEKEIASLLERAEHCKKEINDANLSIEELEGKHNKLEERLKSKCWKKSKSIREQFVKTQSGYRSSKQIFLDEVRKHNAKEHDLKRLNKLYSIAYSKSARPYPMFNEIQDITSLDNVSGNEVLSKVIVNSSNTNLADFLKKIGATEWARRGHEQFHTKADGRCPYCSQPLDSDFESEFIKSFDEQYENSIQELSDFLKRYRGIANNLFIPLEKKPDPLYPAVKIEEYNDNLQLIKSTIASNIEKIKLKIKKPSEIVALEEVTPLLEGLSKIIEKFNNSITENNEIVTSRNQKREECQNEVFEYLANILNDDIEEFDLVNKEINKSIQNKKHVVQTALDSISSFKKKIERLNKQTVETETTMNHINLMLKDSGFQGFRLVPKQKVSGTLTRNYEIVRTESGQVAKNLSEGERNFIAFMYFLQQVYGKNSTSEEIKKKIVIIDDPVTSMDSGTMFIIGSEIRKLIEICRNNVDNREGLASGDLIKQIFIFTHNAFFQRDITYLRAKEYKYVSFYLITKHDNCSEIKLCEKIDPNCPTQKVNVNPIKNAYTALWQEYKETKSCLSLMNVIQRILEYYFLQICGYTGDDIRKRVLIDHRDEFSGKDDGTERYQLVSSMLAHVSATTSGIHDDLLFVDSDSDENIDQYRKIFKLIFSCMGQEQHFNMMLEEA